MKRYHYTCADGRIFDTPSECRAHYRAVMKEDGITATRYYKGARWCYRKDYDDDRRPSVYYKTNGYISRIVTPAK